MQLISIENNKYPTLHIMATANKLNQRMLLTKLIFVKYFFLS